MGTGMQSILEAYTAILTGIYIAYAMVDILTGAKQTPTTKAKD